MVVSSVSFVAEYRHPVTDDLISLHSESSWLSSIVPSSTCEWYDGFSLDHEFMVRVVSFMRLRLA